MAHLSNPNTSTLKRELDESSEKSSSSKRPRTTDPPASSSFKNSQMTVASTSKSKILSSSTCILLSETLSEIHPDYSLTGDAALVLEHMIHAFLASIKVSAVVEKNLFTLPIVQNCLGIVLQDCDGLLKCVQSEGTKAVTEATTTTTTPPSHTPMNSKAAFRSDISSIFQTTNHSFTEPALIFLSAVAIFFAAEFLELAGNSARDNERKEVHPGDIKIAMNNDEELNTIFKILNPNQFESWASINDGTFTFQLVSGVDGQVQYMSKSSLLSHWSDLNRSMSLTLLSEMNMSSEVKIIIPNVTSAGIQALLSWHFSSNYETFTDTERWRQLNITDPSLYANVLMAADFLGCDELCNDLLHSFDHLATDPIDTIRSCYKAVPNFAEMLYVQLGFPNVNACESFLTKLTTSPPEDLTYIELQLCDGMYLCEGALHNISKPLEIQLDATWLPSPLFQHYQYESFKQDGFNLTSKDFLISTNLNLTKWTNKERLRRKEMFDVEREANKSVRSSFKNNFQTLDKDLWQAVAKDDLAAAKELYKQGACANLWMKDDDDIMPYDKYISNGNFNTEPTYISNGDGMEFCAGLTTLMQASQNNSIAMMTWLIDVGCDVNAPVPQQYTGDGDKFGGATALVCASTPDAVNLLLSRGALTTMPYDWTGVKSSIWYIKSNFYGSADPCTILATHLELRRGSNRDLIARALVRHGANVNEACYPCDLYAQDWKDKAVMFSSPTSYWPSVVASGDVLWAKELIEKYNANINWPNTSDAYFKGKVTGLGATVSY